MHTCILLHHECFLHPNPLTNSHSHKAHIITLLCLCPIHIYTHTHTHFTHTHTHTHTHTNTVMSPQRDLFLGKIMEAFSILSPLCDTCWVRVCEVCVCVCVCVCTPVISA